MPILVSAAGIFFASFVSWVIIGHHNPGWAILPDEAANVIKLKNLYLPAGRYIFPCARTKQDMEDEAKTSVLASGLWGTINIWSGPPNTGRNLGLTFLFYLVTAIFVAYLGTLALEPGTGFRYALQVTGPASVLAHCFAFMPNNTWFGAPRRVSSWMFWTESSTASSLV